MNYNRATATANLRQIVGREQASGASLIRTFDYPSSNISQRIVSVPTAKLAATESLLRAQTGVQSIGITGERRYRTATSAVYTNDPYFDGFAPSNFEMPPYSESATVPGQWDMHAIGLEHAFGYSVHGNTYSSTIAALGLASIKIAIIDTGEDASHPELAGKIGYQKCFVSGDQLGSTPSPQTSGNFSTDEDGHGTDVSGIAAAANNNLGFTGAGGASTIYAYRVFPTPDDTCASETNSDDTCSSSTADIASAIDDAVTRGVNVISMSLGGGTCSAGVDGDSVEGAAVNNAITHNIIVVAASGNNGPTPANVTAPGCDSGVIAVGATSLDDGAATGTTSYTTTRVSTATSTNPVEYVASYSQYDSTNPTGWGIVAPGGDPSNAELSGTADDLHWIENIWTSTPFIGYTGDQGFLGNCDNDYPAPAGTKNNPDCRTLIAGTSMATPHVAGAAALILAVNSSYQNPAMMKQLLCATADDLGDSHQGCGRLNVYNAMGVAIMDTAKNAPVP